MLAYGWFSQVESNLRLQWSAFFKKGNGLVMCAGFALSFLGRRATIAPMNIAIITGASSGLGREYARAADESGHYDELWVIARRVERLEELAKACTTPVRAISLDLAQANAIEELSALLQREKPTVGLLVNAAGFGKFGTYADLTVAEVSSMITVNCNALVCLTQAVLPFMTRGSRILQIASSAAFQPLPGLDVYAATKAFVLSYTRALRFELRGRGIRVTAVCPIWVRTEFIDVARQTANGATVKNPAPSISPERVVRWSLFVNRMNYPVATCCVSGVIMRFAGKILPAPLEMWAWEGLRRL